jgi:hypothetical protein
MSYIGSPPSTQSFAPGTDTFNGDGTTVAFTLSRNVATVNDILVVVNNVEQQPTAYSVSVSTLTFSAAPSAGTANIYVRYLSTNLTAIAPQQSSVYPSSMSTGGPSWDASGNVTATGNITATSFTSASTFGFKNRIINGAMVIDQRNSGAAATLTDGVYTLDRWRAFLTQTSKYTLQQNAGAVTPPSGFTNYLGVTSSSAYSVGSGDYFMVGQAIEGFNTADLGWGTASAHTVTLSFRVYSSLTGTFGGALQNQAQNRSYPFTYSIPVANTWTTISLTIPGDTTGTWLTTNGIGLLVRFSLGMGSTLSGTAGAWSGSTFYSATGAVSVVGTNGATFYITGVQLEKGITATSFDYRPYGTELQLCQRYYQVNGVSAGWSQSTTSVSGIAVTFAVTMRAVPTATLISGTNAMVDPAVAFRNVSSIVAGSNNLYGLYIDATSSATTANKLQTLLSNTVSFSAEL